MADAMRQAAAASQVALQVNQCGALLCPYFTSGPVRCFADTQRSYLEKFRTYFWGMQDHHMYIAPSQYEATFVNASHTEQDVEAFCQAAVAVINAL